MRPPSSAQLGLALSLTQPTGRVSAKSTIQMDQINAITFIIVASVGQHAGTNHLTKKTLTQNELSEGRKYLQILLGKYNAANNISNPTLPNGNRPTTTPTGSSTAEKDTGKLPKSKG